MGGIFTKNCIFVALLIFIMYYIYVVGYSSIESGYGVDFFASCPQYDVLYGGEQ
jgi:hypothetical protein